MKAIDELSVVDKRELLKFVTGSNNLPAGGLQSLHPKMSIQKMTKVGIDTDQLLPATFVCANTLNLPPYSSGEILRAKLRLAITDGRDTFLLA
jgi:E3 ubiquitin-protein ligase TRIP12